MRYWDVTFLPEAAKDRNALETSARNQVDKAIRKVSQNPLPKSEGGYGNPLGYKQGRNLTGFLKIKLKNLGIRIVYELIRDKSIMQIIVIATRADSEVYDITNSRVHQ
jgi:mRNA interferase RelE/StbE